MDYNKIIALMYEARKFVFTQRQDLDIKNKNPYDFVTIVDTQISDFMKLHLKEAFPDVGFVTEEENVHCFQDKYFIIDPIDGTTNLIYDYKMSSISLAYVEEEQVRFGAVFNPFANELFFAIRGKGSYLFKTEHGISELLKIGVDQYRENPLRVSERPLGESIIEFGACSSHKEIAAENFKRAQRIFEQCLDLRRVCSTAIAICYIAAARLDGYFEKYIKPWDYAAGILILEEAGGTSSNWDGSPLPLDKGGTIICSNQKIYRQLLDMIYI